MGVILDTSVLIAAEKSGGFDFNIYQDFGAVFMSAISVSELLLGVHYANTAARRAKRSAFVETMLSAIDVLDFTREVARLHADITAALRTKGRLIGSHNLIIAATGLYHGFPVVTGNTTELSRVEGLRVLPLV